MAYQCEQCDRTFGSRGAFNQHRTDSPLHHFCGVCSKEFTTWTGLKEHWVQSPRHSYCQYCDNHFDNSGDLEYHYEKFHWYCRPCNRVFSNKDGLQQHNSKSCYHHSCEDFQTENNRGNSTNSSIYRPKVVACPYEGCDMKFVSRSALALHLESGCCKSGTDLDTIDEETRHYDRDNIITDPAHQDYICPDSTCRIRFATFSALCQHIESKRCRASKVKAVRRIMNSVLGRVPGLAI